MAFHRFYRWVIYGLLGVMLFGVICASWVYWYLTESLAQLDGRVTLDGLTEKVVIERDVQGIPTIISGNRTDSAFGLGFLHGQERFFQMDLLRRNSAGELSALVGAAALNHDKRIRIHQFRKRAIKALDVLPENHRALVQSYVDGVNAGLMNLDKPPFEYLLLQTEPEPWRVEDSLLVLYSMYMDLQPEWNEREQSLAAMKANLPADWFAFLTPPGGKWDAPIHGEAFTQRLVFPRQPLSQLQLPKKTDVAWHYTDEIQVGSNNWAVAGFLTEYSSAMVANDMHLGLSVPNIWYRASWFVSEPTSKTTRRITGVSLPGTPVMVVGSNESIAWGFTNSYGDFHDSIVLKSNENESAYQTPSGWKEFGTEIEKILVKDAEPITVEVKTTQWGPVIGKDYQGKLIALRWVAHDAEGANLNSLGLETANTVQDAFKVAASAGVPGQNLLVADKLGNQGWTIMGRIPKRVGFDAAGIDPSFPADWSQGGIGWNGYLTADEYPRVINPPGGRLWTANARVVSDGYLSVIGDGGYALGARQQQIEKNLYSQNLFTEKDFLAIALDDRALFLSRWQQLLLKILNEESASQYKQPAALKVFVTAWEARASKSSVGYWVVKRFRENVINNSTASVLLALDKKIDGDNRTQNVFLPNRVTRALEYPTWELITQQPSQHTPRDYKSWDAFLQAMAIKTFEDLTAENADLAKETWGNENQLTIRHPLSGAIPVLGRWLDMKSEPMNGDTYMPRVQFPSSGASERMVVAPGHEDKGIFHMPAGQSGHPLSPFYRRGHQDWVQGTPSPFLPGDTEWTLILEPRG